MLDVTGEKKTDTMTWTRKSQETVCNGELNKTGNGHSGVFTKPLLLWKSISIIYWPVSECFRVSACMWVLERVGVCMCIYPC